MNKEKLSHIKLLLMDVDGVVTDGKISYLGREELTSFHVQDGLGIVVAQEKGLKVGWVSRRHSLSLLTRGENLGVTYLYLGRENKAKAVEEIMEKEGLKREEVAYIGDDVNDLPVFELVGVRFAVANAREEVKKKADYVTSAKGGEGAVREVVEIILKAKGLWDF
ncbi:HAD hydrolase family protein [Candidatus Calescamantes bacterium]|nr:HAD hydrolase family protein [Candidatus Calescamantes bacterium]